MPKCPICKEEINSVIVVWKKESFDTACIVNGKLKIFYDFDNETSWDFSRYECPECVKCGLKINSEGYVVE